MPTIRKQRVMLDTNVILRHANGNHILYPLVAKQADAALRTIEQLFQLLPEIGAVYSTWRQLVTTVGVSGVQVHDARLIAIMRVNQLSHLLTFNAKDFTRYHSIGITTVDPVQMSEM